MSAFWALILFAAAIPAFALEGDPAVTVGGVEAVGTFTPRGPVSAGTAVLEIGPSDPFAEPYDTVLFQGELPDAGVTFEASREEASGWSPWLSAAVSRSPDGRFWAKAVFPGPGKGRLRLRALAGGQSSGAAIVIYELRVYLSAQAPGSPSPGPAPQGAGGSAPLPLPVIEREAWGAKPPKEPYSPHRPDRFTQHHSQGRRPRTLEQSLAEVLFIQEFHQKGRGWNDIAYHFLVDPEGRIFRGRPVEVVGAHVLNDNRGNVGVCFMGSHHPPVNDPVTSEQIAASVRIGRWLEASYGVTPDSFKGHRDRGQTDCPGDVLYALLPRIRAEWRGAAPLGARLQSWFEGLRRRAFGPNGR